MRTSCMPPGIHRRRFGLSSARGIRFILRAGYPGESPNCARANGVCMADRIRHFSSRSGCIPLLFLVTLLGACASPEALERRLDELQPVALDAAKERARTDLGCEESIATSVIS